MKDHSLTLRVATATSLDPGAPAAPMDALLVRCRLGEAEAWRQLYVDHFGFIYRVARRLGTPSQELEDVCQEVFVVAFRKMSSFREGKLRTWLYRIAANVVSDRHRRRRIRRILDAVFSAEEERRATAASPEHLLEEREAEALVSEVLQRMSAKKREVLVLHEIEGLSGPEIAEWVGCKVETVWTRLHYAREDFERILSKRRDDYQKWRRDS